MSKLCIFQNGDEPQIVSTAAMMKAAGYDTMYCGQALRQELSSAGCDTVLGPNTMESLGYDILPEYLKPAEPRHMERCDLFLEIKVRNVPKITTRWPRLKNRIAWWRVNGAQPEICPKGGDEVNLPCPVITACFWYGTERYRNAVNSQQQASLEHEANQPARDPGPVTYSDNGMAYVFWPPYPHSHHYDIIDRSKLTTYDPPYTLCHSARAWGYAQIIDDCVGLGVKIYGNRSPAGQIQHQQVPSLVRTAKALVHLKSVDCPGWALYEAILGGCPVITPRLLNSRMIAYDLLQHGKTCYEFGVPASLEYGRGDMNFPKCLEDIKEALDKLSDPEENRRIGEAGRKRLHELMWNEARDGDDWRRFMKRHFG